MTFRRTWAIARKEILHILRDKRSLMAALTQPLMVLLLFGYALSLDVDQVKTMVYDLDHTPQSEGLIREFYGSRYFDVIDEAGSYREIENAMDREQARVGVVIPNDYAKNLLQGRTAEVQVLIDGSDSNTASIALGYAEGLIQTYAVRWRDEAESERAGRVVQAPVEARVRVWYNTDLESKNYIVPGLIGVITMIIAALLTSLTVAREWENGTMEQLLSTPVRPSEMALGKLIAYFLLGFVDMMMAILAGVYVFDVPIKGNPWLLLLAACIFLAGGMAWGIFISATSRNQLTAYQIGVFTSFLPAFLLSGFVYSLNNMPAVIRFFAIFVPARYFITVAKGIFLKGIGIKLLWFDILLLVLYMIGVFFLTARKLRQKVA